MWAVSGKCRKRITLRRCGDVQRPSNAYARIAATVIKIGTAIPEGLGEGLAGRFAWQ
jgi:hypothetical protein